MLRLLELFEFIGFVEFVGFVRIRFLPIRYALCIL